MTSENTSDKDQSKALNKTDVSKRYYFKSNGFNNDTATERCMFKDNGTMIGSIACQNCQYCIDKEKPCEFTGEVNWIVCSKIKLAKG